MKKIYLFTVTAALAVLMPSAARAQATAAATRGGIVQAGIGYTNSGQDEYKQRLQGMTIYGTMDLNAHLGIEADVHMASIFKSYFQYKEQSYDVGLRYAYHRRRFVPYAKGMIGIGRATAASPTQIYAGNVPNTYMLFAVGGGLDYSLTDRINVRAVDFEYQRWPNFVPHGLTPSLLTFGVAYRIR
jgi:opacity protein-like surface antigen